MPLRNLLLPPALPRGGTIGIVAPASPVSREAFDRGLEVLEGCGFRTVVGEHVFKRYGHLAGSDQERADDLHAMFARHDVDAVLCARGGSGSIRLLRHLDFELIAANAKPFLGYSDITSLQIALLQRCGMPSFFAPMVTSDFAKEPNALCLETLWRLVCEPSAAGLLIDPRCGEATTLVGGTAEGPLAGGTLALVAATLGTPYEVQTEGAIFCFEDVYESPARIERYLAQLLYAGKLAGAAGFLIGDCPHDADEEEKARYLTVEQVYADLLTPLGKPAVFGWPFGHVPSPVTLPMGVRARINADDGELEILEPAVVER